MSSFVEPSRWTRRLTIPNDEFILSRFPVLWRNDMREEKDRGSKWLLEHHGDSVLRLGGISGFSSWRSVRSELTHPRQLPDSLLEATFPGQEAPSLYVVEVATYPERRAEEEAARNAMLVFLERGVVPEVLTLVGARLTLRGRRRAEAILQLRADYLSDGAVMEGFGQRRQAAATGQRNYRTVA
jgi:hypothetical protein